VTVRRWPGGEGFGERERAFGARLAPRVSPVHYLEHLSLARFARLLRPRDRLRADFRQYDTRSRLGQGRNSAKCAIYISCRSSTLLPGIQPRMFPVQRQQYVGDKYPGAPVLRSPTTTAVTGGDTEYVRRSCSCHHGVSSGVSREI
jgi:hypothetical protein